MGRKWEKVGAVGTRQHQCIGRWQLRLLGVSDAELAERIAHHGWKRKGAGVIGLPGPDTAYRKLAAVVLAYSRPTDAAERVADRMKAGEGEIDAVVEVAMTARQVVAGLSALWLHGIAPKPATHTIRLTKKSGVDARAGVALRLGPVTGAVHRIEGLPVADVEQAFMDASAGDDTLTPLRLHHQLTKHLATADRKRATTLAALTHRLEHAGRFVGKPALRRAIADLKGELSHSATERKARAIVARVLATYGLALEPRPHTIEVAGHTVGEADLAVVAITLDIEIDGPHHLLPDQVRADQRRDRGVRRAGWEVERFSTELVDLWPVKFAAQVEECVRFRLGLASGSDAPA